MKPEHVGYNAEENVVIASAGWQVIAVRNRGGRSTVTVVATATGKRCRVFSTALCASQHVEQIKKRQAAATLCHQ